MPEEADHAATTTPMITTASEPLAAWPVAEVTAWLSTPDACGGRALSRPWTRNCTVPDLTWIRLATPSSAISAGNRVRNQ
jgi:hypothetical protein